MRTSVPLTAYDFYAPLVELTTRIGEVNIFCADPLVGYSLSSGTTGPQKRIPYTAGPFVNGPYSVHVGCLLNKPDTQIIKK